MVSFWKDWAEIVALILLVIGAILAVAAGSLVMSYLIISIMGAMFGRLWFRYRESFSFTWAIITIGFLLGYLIGNYYGSDLTVALLFLMSLIVSYQLHKRGMVKSIEY